MTEEQGVFTIVADSRKNLWFTLLDGVIKLPGAVINRKTFLEQEFTQFCDKELVDKIVAEGPVAAEVDTAVLNRAAEDVIRTYRVGGGPVLCVGIAGRIRPCPCRSRGFGAILLSSGGKRPEDRVYLWLAGHGR
jgi:hypothetical protein